ncbi:MAG TPA: hypothetical protein VMV92_33520 [Streptosporangiaceae bacterium]|nr:hypothetical protein [Streptosporangiaceae bacterium]
MSSSQTTSHRPAVVLALAFDVLCGGPVIDLAPEGRIEDFRRETIAGDLHDLPATTG